MINTYFFDMTDILSETSPVVSLSSLFPFSLCLYWNDMMHSLSTDPFDERNPRPTEKINVLEGQLA